jgi:hypothetical protein
MKLNSFTGAGMYLVPVPGTCNWYGTVSAVFLFPDQFILVGQDTYGTLSGRYFFMIVRVQGGDVEAVGGSQPYRCPPS